MASLQAALSPSSSNRQLVPAVQIAFLPTGIVTSCGVVVWLANSLYALADRMLNHWPVNANTWVQPASKSGVGHSMRQSSCAKEGRAVTGTEGVCCKRRCGFSAKARESITLVIWIGSSGEDKTSYS
jgi:hypothetical protein